MAHRSDSVLVVEFGPKQRLRDVKCAVSEIEDIIQSIEEALRNDKPAVAKPLLAKINIEHGINRWVDLEKGDPNSSPGNLKVLEAEQVKAKELYEQGNKAIEEHQRKIEGTEKEKQLRQKEQESKKTHIQDITKALEARQKENEVKLQKQFLQEISKIIWSEPYLEAWKRQRVEAGNTKYSVPPAVQKLQEILNKDVKVDELKNEEVAKLFNEIQKEFVVGSEIKSFDLKKLSDLSLIELIEKFYKSFLGKDDTQKSQAVKQFIQDAQQMVISASKKRLGKSKKTHSERATEESVRPPATRAHGLLSHSTQPQQRHKEGAIQQRPKPGGKNSKIN